MLRAQENATSRGYRDCRRRFLRGRCLLRARCDFTAGLESEHPQQGHLCPASWIRREIEIAFAVYRDLVVELYVFRIELAGQISECLLIDFIIAVSEVASNINENFCGVTSSKFLRMFFVRMKVIKIAAL